MQIFRSIFSAALFAAVCASVSGCANTPSPPPEPQAQPADGPQPRLTIQAGEGEKLNLPWFVRDAQHWINE